MRIGSGASGGCKAEFDGVALCVLRVKRLLPPLQGLNSFGWLTQGGASLALGYYLSGFQPCGSAFISVNQRFNSLRSMRSLAAK